MKKIEGLYRSYCHERELEMQEYHTGGNRMKELQEFLKSKLSLPSAGRRPFIINGGKNASRLQDPMNFP